MKDMKKMIVFVTMMCVAFVGFAQEEVKDRNKGEMKFEHTRHDFGVFAQDTAVVTHEFVFTNVGKSPLIIHQANASCGCTVPEYTLEPIMPGEKGKITVTYNGKGRRPGVFRKSITIHNNGKQTPVRIYIEGEMIGEELPIREVEVIQDSTLYQVVGK
jgi:hypothetical protein